ncbi:hypothetical protein BS47DRAFT_689578 [Hydnum rufescens UP504]|uniref:Uncharacterized protein n=1 Tax=Hydnum rufescens UP504 TaxID=1448309 RepID=A0A9P6B2C5_9AGAM|nr:hypothetical protein BS47DRAFT_689578 [Hydnum rufescens UP504]
MHEYNRLLLTTSRPCREHCNCGHVTQVKCPILCLERDYCKNGIMEHVGITTE